MQLNENVCAINKPHMYNNNNNKIVSQCLLRQNPGELST